MPGTRPGMTNESAMPELLTAFRIRLLSRLVRHRQFGKADIVGIDDIGETAHLADAELFQFGVFVTG
jgi:hypothetical protein